MRRFIFLHPAESLRELTLLPRIQIGMSRPSTNSGSHHDGGNPIQ